MTRHTIENVGELRALYGHLPEDAIAMKIVLKRLDAHHRAFIALSPFLALATADALGRPDVSPRGDMPGFVKVIDEETLLIPDRPGNKKLSSLTNLLVNQNLALIFFIPGRDETLRLKGKGTITTHPDDLAPLAIRDKNPRSAIRVRIEEAHLHCGKAVIRSRLWAPVDIEQAKRALPSFAQMLSDQVAGLTTADATQRLETSYTQRLWTDSDK